MLEDAFWHIGRLRPEVVYPAIQGPSWGYRSRARLSVRLVPKKGGVVHHPIVTDVRSLLWLTNQNTITQHVWASRTPHLDRPDLCIFDLDPPDDDVDNVRAAAIGLRDLLAELGLPSWIKTSGSKGFHIVVPLDGKAAMSDQAVLLLIGVIAVAYAWVAFPRRDLAAPS